MKQPNAFGCTPLWILTTGWPDRVHRPVQHPQYMPRCKTIGCQQSHAAVVTLRTFPAMMLCKSARRSLVEHRTPARSHANPQLQGTTPQLHLPTTLMRVPAGAVLCAAVLPAGPRMLEKPIVVFCARQRRIAQVDHAGSGNIHCTHQRSSRRRWVKHGQHMQGTLTIRCKSTLRQA
jgi:hypothetical protein